MVLKNYSNKALFLRVMYEAKITYKIVCPIGKKISISL